MRWEVWFGIRLIKRNKSKLILCLFSLLIGLAMFLGIYMGIGNAKNIFLSMSSQKYGNADFLLEGVKASQINTIENDNKIENEIDRVMPFSQSDVYFYHKSKFFQLSQLNIDMTGETDSGTINLMSGNLPKQGEALISENEAESFSWSVGDVLEIKTDQGIVKMKVSGVIKNQGLGINNEGYVLVQDAQYVSNISEYKVITKNSASVDKIIPKIQSKLNGNGQVIPVGRKSGDELKEVQIFFNALYGFSLLVMLIGLYIVFITIRKFSDSLKKEIAILKVLGANQKSIVQIFLAVISFIALVSIMAGGALSIGIGKGLFIALSSSLRMGTAAPFSVPLNAIFLFCLAFYMAVVVITWLSTTKRVRESVLEGFNPFPAVKDKAVRKKVWSIALSIAVLFRIFVPQKFAWLMNGLICLFLGYLLIQFIFPYVAKYWGKLTGKPSPEIGLMFYSTAMKFRNKNGQILFVFILLNILIISGESVFSSFNITLDKMIDEIYYGDAIVTTSVGKGVDPQIVAKINKFSEVKTAVPVYQEYQKLQNVNCQVVGVDNSKEQAQILEEYDGVYQDQFEKIQNSDSALVSNLVMNLNGWNVGKQININQHKIIISGTYSSSRNDGKSVILSQNVFTKIMDRPIISFVKVTKSDKSIDTSEFITLLNRKISNPYVVAKDLKMQKNIERTADQQFITVMQGLLLFFAVMSLLILLNTMAGNKQDNIEADNILRILGATKSTLIKRNVVEGLYYVIVSGIFSVIVGRALSGFLIGKINEAIFWNLPQIMAWKSMWIYLFILCSFTVLIEINMTKWSYARR